MITIDILDRVYAKKLVTGLQSGLDHAVVNNTDCSITFYWKDGTNAKMTIPKPLDGAKGDKGTSISDVKLKKVTVGSDEETHLFCILDDGTEIDAGKLPSTGSGGTTDYDDTQIKADIANLKTNKQDKTDNTLNTTDKTVIGAINEVNDSLLDNVTFSSDYKNIILNRKSGLNPYTIPIASIIHNAKIIELNDVDTTNIGDGKTLIYDATTKKHKYVGSTGTDELVKMEASTDAKYLSDLIDKNTIVNDNGTLKVKKLDGQEVTIAEINYLKGLTMNVMDLVNAFANGGVKVLNTPVNTYADLSTLDRSSFLDGISYIVYVLADETHFGAKTTYLCDKTSETYFGNADSQRNFITNPIDLANEVTGKLGTSNIDVDALWSLLTINDTYKTLTTKDEVFGTHGAKALYDELVTAIGEKANASDLTTHTDDTDIHITSAEREAWNNKANDDEVVKKTDIKTTLDENSTNTDICGGKAIFDAILKNNSGASYSTNEQLTGGTWIDGKPIYRRVVQVLVTTSDTLSEITVGRVVINQLTADGTTTEEVTKNVTKPAYLKRVDLSSFNIKQVTGLYGSAIGDNGNASVYCPCDYGLRAFCHIYYSYGSKELAFRVGEQYATSNTTWDVVLEYTKTTD